MGAKGTSTEYGRGALEEFLLRRALCIHDRLHTQAETKTAQSAGRKVGTPQGNSPLEELQRSAPVRARSPQLGGELTLAGRNPPILMTTQEHGLLGTWAQRREISTSADGLVSLQCEAPADNDEIEIIYSKKPRLPPVASVQPRASGVFVSRARLRRDAPRTSGFGTEHPSGWSPLLVFRTHGARFRGPRFGKAGCFRPASDEVGWLLWAPCADRRGTGDIPRCGLGQAGFVQVWEGDRAFSEARRVELS